MKWSVAIFIEHPWLAACLGGVLIGFGWLRRRRLAAIAGGVWLLYAAYETGMYLRWLCSGECNIRVDLLLIYPLLVVATLVGAASLLRSRGRAGEER